ncbi:MAG TPA: DUF433 domain-containing protein [Thermoanaerobaculia bacterium]|nr:DUF433 domain-containing protein [Thermoanaerobaculia bacterium]
MTMKPMSIYGGRDPREIPAYSFADAGRLLTVNPSTIRNWAKGHPRFLPVLTIPAKVPNDAVSFFNLIEIFVLDELRRRHRFSLQRLRPYIAYMRGAFPGAAYPLAQVDLFVSNNELFGRFERRPLVNISRGGQLGLEEVLRDLLQRVEKGPTGEGIVKLYPFITKRRLPDSPPVVEVKPRVSFGRPVVRGTGVPTAVVAQRFDAGESIAKLAEEYDRTPEEIEQVIRYESARRAA